MHYGDRRGGRIVRQVILRGIFVCEGQFGAARPPIEAPARRYSGVGLIERISERAPDCPSDFRGSGAGFDDAKSSNGAGLLAIAPIAPTAPSKKHGEGKIDTPPSKLTHAKI